MHSCSKWIISKPRNAILSHFGVFFVFGRIVCHRASFRPGDKEMIVNGLEEEITHAVKPERCIFATNRFFRGSEMQFCHISRYSSFFPVHSYEWTFLARRYGERCPPYLVSTLTPKQTANRSLLILLRRRRRQKEVHMTEMKRKPILIPIDHGYGVRP